MFNILKWVGIAALVSVPVFLLVRSLQEEVEESTLEDDFDIFAEEVGL